MSAHRVAAITKRLLQQFRRDRRTLALLFVAPIVILGLLGYLIRGSASAPAVGIANEDLGPLGATVSAALARSSEISTTTIQASDGDSKLKDGSLAAYIVFPSDFSSQAQAGTIAPDVHLEGSQPGTIAPVLQALQQALISVASSAPGQGLHVQPHLTYLYGGSGFDTLDYFVGTWRCRVDDAANEIAPATVTSDVQYTFRRAPARIFQPNQSLDG